MSYDVPATFQHYMITILSDFVEDIMEACLDD